MSGASARNSCARILILDDHALGLMARRSVLEELGHKVHSCSSAEEGLIQLGRQHYDLIITDYKMPAMNGIDFITELRARKLTVPVILISGFVETLGFNQANTGADIVLQKNSHEVPNLISAVNRLLKKRPGPARKPPNPQGSSGPKRRRA